MDYKEETNGLELWIPRSSNYYKNAKWLEENYPSTLRTNIAILTTKEETILSERKIRNLLHIHKGVNQISTENEWY